MELCIYCYMTVSNAFSIIILDLVFNETFYSIDITINLSWEPGISLFPIDTEPSNLIPILSLDLSSIQIRWKVSIQRCHLRVIESCGCSDSCVHVLALLLLLKSLDMKLSQLPFALISFRNLILDLGLPNVLEEINELRFKEYLTWFNEVVELCHLSLQDFTLCFHHCRYLIMNLISF